ncbi:MAG TPA: sensor histidine kinase, partial [Candidatus Atribacteria bacterium]|nr:sensor histidine kinase [Candidatus Atribacteria bacterium]
KKGGIALLNVKNRIKRLFGDEYGIYIYSKPGIGTDVEITLPIIR